MAKAITRTETRGSLLLWIGIFAAPLAWTVQIAVAPDLNEILCGPGATATGRGEVYGWPMKSFLIALTIACVAVGVLGGLAAWRCHARLRRSGMRSDPHRASWMSLAGILVSTLFVLSMAINLIPLLVLPTACEASL